MAVITPGQSVTMLFSDVNQTWSETHWSVTSPGFAALSPLATSLANLRVSLLGYGARLLAVRMSDLGNPRNVQYVTGNNLNLTNPLYGTGGPTSIAGAAQSDAAIANTAVQLLLRTSGPNKRLYLAGNPQDATGTDPTSQRGIEGGWNAAWYKAIIQYINVGGVATGAYGLCGGGWGCLAKLPTNPQSCVAVVPTGAYAGNAAVSTTNPLVSVVGQKILVKGFRSVNSKLKGLSGVYTILAIQSGNVYVLSKTSALQVANVQSLPGTAFDLKYQVCPYTFGTFSKAGSRKRGARVFAPAGRFKIRH
jgi:hypothetical protein